MVRLAADLHLRFRTGAGTQRRHGDRRLCGALPLDFPGTAAAFDSRRDLTDASLLARAMKYIAVTPACRNEAFNVANGDVVSWRGLWPGIAAHFGIAAGEARPFS